MRNWFLLILIILTSTLSAQEEKVDLQSSEAVLATERAMDLQISQVNKRLRNHSKLLVMRTKVLPAQTVFYKGKGDGDKCIIAPDQTAGDNNCIHLEVYDFKDSERGLSAKSLGSLNKALTIFFAGQAPAESDPRKVPPRDIEKIFTRVYMNDFINGELIISEITDESPGTEPLDNKNLFLFFQENGNPFHGTEENPAQKGVGRYNLSVVENSTSHDIRNDFKKKYYFKHVDQFDKLFSKIFSFNDRDGNDNYRNNIRVLRDSLKY
ncbi:hypothetical protein [Leptospira sp. GIMC2001]|uniref:hypothetical protein n=1 Tax=Leptospira sp. GIMC2001 TaxID=1513297 RepID=UPI00234B377F|nr:hypothetical protein [Leptospira sp. GIMC2001]WCL50957.1 hypothetical protein O4O04_09140 [Leptospira sp. GIMC2001]